MMASIPFLGNAQKITLGSTTTKDGGEYQGEMVAGKPQGKGKAVYKNGNTYEMLNGCYLGDHTGYKVSLYLIGYDSDTKKIEAPVLEIDETNGVYRMKNNWIINADYTDKVYWLDWFNAGTTIAIEGEDTGISEVKTAKAALTGKTYNLAGQQVGKQYKGIIVRDGKKLLNK